MGVKSCTETAKFAHANQNSDEPKSVVSEFGGDSNHKSSGSQDDATGNDLSLTRDENLQSEDKDESSENKDNKKCMGVSYHARQKSYDTIDDIKEEIMEEIYEESESEVREANIKIDDNQELNENDKNTQKVACAVAYYKEDADNTEDNNEAASSEKLVVLESSIEAEDNTKGSKTSSSEVDEDNSGGTGTSDDSLNKEDNLANDNGSSENEIDRENDDDKEIVDDDNMGAGEEDNIRTLSSIPEVDEVLLY